MKAITRKYTSQFGQDKWVIEEIFDFKKKGYFLDLAAGDGVFLSNTYFLEKYLDWRGICIEANDVLFKQLIKNRSCFCENACVDDKRQKVKFTNYFLLNEKYKILLGGIIEEDINKHGAVKNEDFIWKTTVTLADILEKYDAPKVIDYFSLDVEGSEPRIMKDFPFNKYTFLSMSVERPGQLLHKILAKNKYIWVNENSADNLYIHKSLLKTFTIGKKLKICYFHVMRVLSISKVYQKMLRHVAYYIKHPPEILVMKRRKLTKFIKWISEL